VRRAVDVGHQPSVWGLSLDADHSATAILTPLRWDASED
jgi:hypothetical protein